MKSAARILLLSDTHLGLDLPERPRVERPRRGEDFFACYEEALVPAFAGEVDLVIHGGDLLYRSRVPAWLVDRALGPLRRLADRGVPVCLLPGNHERSTIPFPILAAHRRLEVFFGPATHVLETRGGLRVAVSGFPHERAGVRDRFRDLLARTGWRDARADVRLLLVHEAVEGATVGPAGFVFRHGPETIRARDLPAGFAAVLAGHIHRHQVLARDRIGRPLAAPVLYPGSTERTSFAERGEPKGYLVLDVGAGDGGHPGGRLLDATFHELPARPMHELRLDTTGLGEHELSRRLAARLRELPARSLVRLCLEGDLAPGARPAVSAASLRSLAPPSLLVTLARPRKPAPPGVP